MATLGRPYTRDIRDFMMKFGLAYGGYPRSLDLDLFIFRRNFMLEELGEYITAWENNDKERMLDALTDLLYVVFGTAHLHGFNIDEAWRRVHEANMRKERAKTKEESTRKSAYDIIKPAGWTPPNLEDLTK